MRAVICSKFGSPEDLEVKEVEEPVTGANQVKLKVEACGVNFPDTLIINNKYQFKPDFPSPQVARSPVLLRKWRRGKKFCSW